MSAKRVLSVGQCGADHGALSRSLTTHFGAEVVAAHTADEAVRLLEAHAFDLVLLNRVFDADGASGLDLVRRLAGGGTKVPVMLVSNHDSAQQEAIQLGARPGFGKASLDRPAMLDRVREVLG